MKTTHDLNWLVKQCYKGAGGKDGCSFLPVKECKGSVKGVFCSERVFALLSGVRIDKVENVITGAHKKRNRLA